MGDESAGVRVDKWLWAARMFKTRTLATAACDGGHVQVNEQPAKPARKVKPGDRVEALTPGGPRVLEVVALGERRGPVEAARALYVDHTPDPEPRPALPPLLRDRGSGRPTKRDRRLLARLRGGE